jgi:hypothetical protein
MEKVASLKVLNDDQQNQKMASKLPKWALLRWGRIVYKWKNEKKQFPPFLEFVNYVVTEADIACDPINSRQHKNEEEFKGLRFRRDNREEEDTYPGNARNERNAIPAVRLIQRPCMETTRTVLRIRSQRKPVHRQNHKLFTVLKPVLRVTNVMHKLVL